MLPGASPSLPERPRLYGVYPALVTDVQDPDAQGRVQVRLPFVEESDGGSALAWARLATLMAGAGRGSWFIPEVDDEVQEAAPLSLAIDMADAGDSAEAGQTQEGAAPAAA